MSDSPGPGTTAPRRRSTRTRQSLGAGGAGDTSTSEPASSASEAEHQVHHLKPLKAPHMSPGPARKKASVDTATVPVVSSTNSSGSSMQKTASGSAAATAASTQSMSGFASIGQSYVTMSSSMKIEKTSEGFLKERDFLDALYNPHTVTGLIVMICAMIYVAFSRDPHQLSTVSNFKAGLAALAAAFLAYCVFQLRDGLLVRPHPMFWRLVHGCGLLYLMLLAFMLFQDVNDVRQWFRYIYPDLGQPLPERRYADNCTIWTPEDPMAGILAFLNTWNDRFIVAHILGHFGKAVMLRDAKLTWVLSIFFEILEVTFQHWMANFLECWWDHIIVDVLTCNAVGIWIGVKFCDWLDMKKYNWVGLNQIPSRSGKAKRVVEQFTPFSWTRYNWDVWHNPRRFAACGFIILLACIVDMNAFTLKFVLWVTEDKLIHIYRLFYWWFLALSAVREWYAYVVETGPKTKRLGMSCWLAISLAAFEFLLVLKYAWVDGTAFTQPFPPNIKVPWAVFFVLFPLWVLLHYTRRVNPSSKFMRALFLSSTVVPFTFLFVSGCPDWRFGEAEFNNWWNSLPYHF